MATELLADKKLLPFVCELPAPDVHYLHLLDDANTFQFHSGCVTLKPGESVGEHSTKEHEEAIVFLQGCAEVHAETLDTPLRVVAPAVSYMPPRTIHNVVNCGNTILRYIYLVAKI